MWIHSCFIPEKRYIDREEGWKMGDDCSISYN